MISGIDENDESKLLDQRIDVLIDKIKNLEDSDIDTPDKVKALALELHQVMVESKNHIEKHPDSEIKKERLSAVNNRIEVIHNFSENEQLLLYNSVNPEIAKDAFIQDGEFIKRRCSLLADINFIEVRSSEHEANPQNVILSFDLISDLIFLSKMIFLPPNKKLMQVAFSNVFPNGVYNNDGYDSTIHSGYTKGNPLTMPDPYDANISIPIGYNVTLPQGEIKSVYVEVYGGSKDLPISTPHVTRSLEKYLLQNGVAIVHTNLYDRIKLDVVQGDMPEELFHQIQECIHYLHVTLKHNPESLDPKLSVIKGKPQYLSGTSFGGLMAIRQAELYPNKSSDDPSDASFDGYFSFNGALSLEVALKSMSPFNVSQLWGSRAWLDPKLFSHLIRDKLFLSQTLDDNAVDAKQLTDFYYQMHADNLHHLVSISIAHEGIPAPSEEQHYYKGHNPSTGTEDFAYLAERMTQFMQKNELRFSALNEWRGFENDRKANLLYKGATPSERFIGYCFFNNVKSCRPEDWERVYKKNYLAMEYVASLKNNANDLQEEIKRLFNKNLLDDDAIKNTIKNQSSILLQFFKEIKGVNTGPLSVDDIINDPKVISIFREVFKILSTNEPHLLRLMLESLYLANPSLLPDALPTVYKKKATAMHKKLIKELETKRSHIVSTWKQTIRQVRQRHIRELFDFMDVTKDYLEKPQTGRNIPPFEDPGLYEFTKINFQPYIITFAIAVSLFPRYSKEIIQRYDEINTKYDQLEAEGVEVDLVSLISIKLCRALLNPSIDRDAVVTECSALWKNSFPYIKHDLNFISDKMNEFGKPISLQQAISDKNKKLIDYLLALDVNVNSFDNFGLSPIHYAVISGNILLVATLIEKGADINTKSVPLISAGSLPDSSGYTPLYFAIKYGNENMARFLIDNGASIDMEQIKNINSYNPKGYIAIVKYLEAKLEVDNQNASPENSQLEGSSNKRIPPLLSPKKQKKPSTEKPIVSSVRKSKPTRST